MQNRTATRRLWITIGAIVIIFLLLTFLVEWEDVFFILGSTDWKIMLFGALVLMVSFIFISSRWRFLLADKPKFIETFHADSIGYMVTVLSPIPGPAVRIVALTQSTNISFSSATPTMAIDLTLGVVMRLVALILAIVLTLSPEDAVLTILIGSGLIGVVLGFVIWLVRNPDKVLPAISRLLTRIPGMQGERLEGSVADLQAGLSSISSTRSILTALLLTFAMSSCFLIFHYLGFLAMSINLSAQEMLTLAAASLVILPPSAPAMIGVYQGALVAFLILFRITDSTTLTAYGILVFAVQLFLWMILGIWSLTRTQLKLTELIQLSRDVLQGDAVSAAQLSDQGE